MLSQWRAANFKPIRGEVSIRLGRLTVLAGLNSSGKSSAIQSILLVSQTLANQNPDRPLILNGHAVRLGTFRSVRNERAGDVPISLGFDLEPDGRGRQVSLPARRSGTLASELPMTIRLDAKFGPSAAGQTSAISDVNVELFESRIDLEVPALAAEPTSELSPSQSTSFWQIGGHVRIGIEPWTASAEQNYLSDVLPEAAQLQLQRLDQRFFAEVRFEADLGGENFGYPVDVAHFLPQRFIDKYDLEERRREIAISDAALLLGDPDLAYRFSTRSGRFPSSQARRASNLLEKEIDEQLRQRLATIAQEVSLPSPEGLKTFGDVVRWARPERVYERGRRPAQRRLVYALAEWLVQVDEGPMPNGKGLEPLRDTRAVDLVDAAVRRITSFFTARLRYLGPLRVDPQAAQGFSPSSEPDDVGTRGEFAASVYDANKRQPVDWWNPLTNGRDRSELERALAVWVRHLGVAHAVETEAGLAGVSWQVKSRESSLGARSLPAVGVGVSQVLPILVAGLLAPPGALLLFEQPELHLHARAQARLGDFFLGLTRLSKQCIVETHSDCLVNQLRLHIATHDAERERDVRIYFVEQDEGGDAQFNPVEISESGNIVNWPEGFFDENLKQSQSIARQSVLSRVRKRSDG